MAIAAGVAAVGGMLDVQVLFHPLETVLVVVVETGIGAGGNSPQDYLVQLEMFQHILHIVGVGGKHISRVQPRMMGSAKAAQVWQIKPEFAGERQHVGQPVRTPRGKAVQQHDGLAPPYGNDVEFFPVTHFNQRHAVSTPNWNILDAREYVPAI